MKRVFALLFLLCNFCAYAKYNATSFQLKNGLRVICVERKNYPVVAFSIWYRCGSQNEKASKSGVAHYLEHMAFHFNNSYLQDFSENTGTYGNAFTCINAICFFEIFAQQYIEEIMKQEAIRMHCFDVSDKKFNIEKSVILEERSMRVESDPDGAECEAMLSNICGNSPRKLCILGWAHEIRSITKEDLRDFHKKYFAPNNAFIIIISDLDPNYLHKLVKKYFEHIEPKNVITPRLHEERPSCTKEMIYRNSKNGYTSVISYIYHVPTEYAYGHDIRKNVAMSLAIDALNMESFCYKKLIQHTLKAAFSMSVAHIDQAIPYIAVRVESSNINDSLECERHWKHLRNTFLQKGIGESELSAAKRRRLISFAYEKNSTFRMMRFFGISTIHNLSLQDMLSIEDIIQTLTLKECNDALRDVFHKPVAIVRTEPKAYDRE